MGTYNLNILYTADRNYIPFTGVSMFSLLKNNAEAKRIRIYAVLDNVDNENKSKLKMVATEFNRELIIIDAEKLNQKLDILGIPKYRGTHSANYRLFFELFVDSDVDMLLYIDSDTIICDSLKSIAVLDFSNFCAGMVLDELGNKYKHLIGFSQSDYYFNSGFIAINVPQWKKNNCTELIEKHIKTSRAKYCNPDQDLLNIVLKNKIKLLPPEYNFQPFHRVYSDKSFNAVYGFKNYYNQIEIENARKCPIVLHTYRFLGEFPWHKDNMHPDNNIFDEYISKTSWANYIKKKTLNNSFLFKLERVLYKILPNIIFLALFSILQEKSFKKQNKKLAKSK